MDRINEFNLEPGLYCYAEDPARQIVVVDVVSYLYNPDKGLPEALADPLVVFRSVERVRVFNTTAFPLSIFKSKFLKA